MWDESKLPRWKFPVEIQSSARPAIRISEARPSNLPSSWVGLLPGVIFKLFRRRERSDLAPVWAALARTKCQRSFLLALQEQRLQNPSSVG